ncbi:hypothetical protein Pcinc_019360 [Petrolisthes cinctipes]|uniref:Transposable element P transposase-like RNase H C-terminal domain-containing protein n=1 Tax=Petrolisthes cinctipes TaxID=88211 RepID=A0AAE1KHU6_PETCI|nr:hypothetical protein Pcinc_019360 [Petrolisthes cinctipes]
MTKAERACVLSFDEMKVTESWEFRRIDESVMSPHKRLNQDILEHFFSVIQQMGRCYDHPTPLSFQQRLKLYIVGKDTAVLASNTNTSEIETTPMIASGIQEFAGSSHDNSDLSSFPETDPSLTSDVFTQDLGTFVDEIDDENVEPEF